MELAQDGDEAVFVNGAVLVAKFLPGPQPLQHVVHGGESDVRMGTVLSPSMGVQFFREFANAAPDFRRIVREGEFVEANCLVVPRIIAVTETAARR